MKQLFTILFILMCQFAYGQTVSAVSVFIVSFGHRIFFN